MSYDVMRSCQRREQYTAGASFTRKCAVLLGVDGVGASLLVESRETSGKQEIQQDFV